MLNLETGLYLPPEQKLVLAIDTRDVNEAEKFIQVAKNCGAAIVKLGLELNKIGLQACSELAGDYDMDWIADFKYNAIGWTMAAPIQDCVELEHKPVGITVTTQSGIEGMRVAQKIADTEHVVIFGAGVLSGIDEAEILEYSKRKPEKAMLAEATRASNARVKGMVTSGRELGELKSYGHTKKLVTLVVGTRSQDVIIEGDDQKRVTTIGEAVLKGADLIVVGRQVTQAKDMEGAYASAAEEARKWQTSPVE